jgi:hypothetical protein
MKHYLSVLCLAFVSLWCNAQDFSYTLSIDSSLQYTDLSNATALSPDSAWLPRYEIQSGFTQNPSFSGNFSIETNGFLIFNKQLNTALMAFSGFHCKVDTNGYYSKLSYTLSGSSGSKLLKLEFKNVGQSNEPSELLSYQLWVHENGVMEVFVGPNTYEAVPGDSLSDTSQVVFMGLINRNMDQSTNGVFVSGSPQNPVPAVLNQEQPNLAYLRTVPKRGYRYIFTPSAP